MARFTIKVNGRNYPINVSPDTPLLWVLRDLIGLTGTKFGCGIGQCGSCTIHLNGNAVRSCVLQVGKIQGRSVTTIEGLSPDQSHPLQKAWIQEQVPQCGYCQSGQIMQAATLLERNPAPTRDEIIRHMDGNLCRCGTYERILRAIERASKEG
ncbi:MAG: (2Fe-2S)-binding protein [Candidatus Binatia bacterium]